MRIDQNEEEVLHRNYGMRADAISDDGDGGFSGTANVMGVMDAYRSVIFPGAYESPVIRAFIDDGFGTGNHNWANDIATIKDARADRQFLRIEAEYYPTDEAQQMRLKVKARHERKKSTGLSVGFSPNWRMVEDFSSGEKLLAYAKGLGADMSLFDPAIAKYEGYCWAIPKVARLYEVAIASVPATPGSQVEEARSVKDFLRADESLRVGIPLEEHSRLLRAAIVGYEARLVEVAASREENGQTPFVERVAQIESIRDSLSSILERCARSSPDLQREVEDFLLGEQIAALKSA